MTTIGSVGNTAFMGSSYVGAEHLTPEGMMIYLQSRLGGIDEQITALIDKQKSAESTRKSLQGLLNEVGSGDADTQIDPAVCAANLNTIANDRGAEAAAEVLSQLPASLRAEIKLNKDGKYEGGKAINVPKAEIADTKTYLETAVKDIESGAELEMIQLQSLMSARNTAISLATNMMSAIGKGQDAVVGNIGR